MSDYLTESIDRNKFKAKKTLKYCSSVYKDFDSKKAKYAIRKLGFDISRNRKQGYLKFNEDSNSMIWKQLSSKVINEGELVGYYRGKDGFLKGNRKYHNIGENSLKEHFYAIESTHSKRHKGLAQHYDEAEAITARIAEKTLGLNEHWGTTVACFDIDNKTGDDILAIETLHTLFEEFEYRIPILFEINPHTKASHIYYQFNQRIEENDLLRFTNYFHKKYPDLLPVDNRYKKKIFRLPGSYTYDVINIDSPLQLIQDDFSENIVQTTEWINNVVNYNNPLKYRSFFNKIKKEYLVKPGESEKPFEINNVESVVQKEHIASNLFSLRKISKPANHNSDLINKLYHEFPIHKGNRIQTMKKIAGLCMYLSLDKDEFYRACMSNNVDSKDFSRWTEVKREEVCHQFFESFKKMLSDNNKIVSSVKSESDFISNIKLLEKHSLTESINNFSEFFYKNSIEPSLSYSAVRVKFAHACKHMIPELIGYILYNYENEMVYNQDSDISFTKFKQLTALGFQFPREYLDRMKAHYNIEVDIHGLFNRFVYNSGLFEQIKPNGNRGWSYGDVSYSRIFQFKFHPLNIKFINIVSKSPLRIYSKNYKPIMGGFLIYNIKDIITININKSINWMSRIVFSSGSFNCKGMIGIKKYNKYIIILKLLVQDLTVKDSNLIQYLSWDTT